MKYNELIKLLKLHGWSFKESGKKHDKYSHPDHDNFLVMPRHQSKEVHKGLLDQILKDAGIKK